MAGYAYTLKQLKDKLFATYNALVCRWSSHGMSEGAFIKAVFPEEFYEGTFGTGENTYTLSGLLKVRGENTQRNRIFNRNIHNYSLYTSVVNILQLRPDLWTETCERCRDLIAEAARPEQLAALLRDLVQAEKTNRTAPFFAFVAPLVETDTGKALAAVILYLMIPEIIDGTESILDLLDLLQSGGSPEEHFDYMAPSGRMLKHTFGTDLTPEHFESVLDSYYAIYSPMMACVATVRRSGKPVACENFLDDLYEALSIEARKLLYICGPAGTEKNTITQLLYLKMACAVRSGADMAHAPFYVSLAYYRELSRQDPEAYRDQLGRDFAAFADFCAGHPDRVPIVFVDGVKNYALEENNPDYRRIGPREENRLDFQLNRLIQDLRRARIVVAAENSALTNKARQRLAPAFASGDFASQVTIEPLYLPSEENARTFLEHFQRLYARENTRPIYQRLRELGFNSIDIYQLRMIFPRMWDTGNLAELYEAACIDFLDGDDSELGTAAQWAFDFTYTDQALPRVSPRMQELLTSHNSILEYFIACWYLSKIREGTLQDNVGMLDMVMPKGVTRFIVPMLNASAADLDHVLELIAQYYQNMGLMAKSEMTYWLGRIKAPTMAATAERMLERFHQAQKAELEKTDPSDPEYKRKLFLMRGISVSLIVKGHLDISDEYLTSLLNNETANEINRGFHLEYYGDKPYLPVYDTLDFMDDITKGERTLNQLLTTNAAALGTRPLPPLFELNLFTICSLLQARAERANPNISFELLPYLKTAVEQIDWYLSYDSGRQRGGTAKMLREYFQMVHRDFENRIETETDRWNPIGADVYRFYTSRIVRTGWKNRGIPDAETDAEHMYHCWMMGSMFLPEYYRGYPDYSKDRILKLLLIHDVAEAKTGDIVRTVKAKNPEHYNREESTEMGIYILRGSYPGMAASPENYSIWQLWNTDDINGRIAREIDTLQTMYQLLCYLKEYPDHFAEPDVQVWLAERDTIRSAPGNEILKTVILENLDFQDILKHYHVI